MSIVGRIRNLGPGAVVAAAFIGPGTVTTSTLAGASFGYVLVWALVFATASTIILQEMSARLGTVGQTGLGEALRKTLETSAWRWPLFGLILIAIFAGNCAYEAGNMSGAALGIEALAGGGPYVFPTAIGGIFVLATILLVFGSYRQIEKVLLTLVFAMAIAFVATFLVVRPDFGALLRGALVPSIPDGSLLTIIALIGTTVVPYNLFLHASAAKARWKGAEDLAAARFDTTITIGLGGLIAILIVSTAAASIFAAGLAVNNAVDMAIQLEPLFGSLSRYLLGVGLFAAGLSSAVTAPLATGYVVTEILKLDSNVTSRAFRAISICVLAAGSLFAITGTRPIVIIVTAQFANGILLPVVVCFLLFIMNRKMILGDHVNGRIANVLGFVVLLVTTGLGVRLLARSMGWL
jgi:Mn2+/Fe2+ NRAMP family transporter